MDFEESVTHEVQAFIDRKIELEAKNKELEARALAFEVENNRLREALEQGKIASTPLTGVMNADGEVVQHSSLEEAYFVCTEALSTPSPEPNKWMAVVEAAKGLHSANKIFEGTPANEVHPALLKVLEPIIDAVEALEGVL